MHMCELTIRCSCDTRHLAIFLALRGRAVGNYLGIYEFPVMPSMRATLVCIPSNKYENIHYYCHVSRSCSERRCSRIECCTSRCFRRHGIDLRWRCREFSGCHCWPPPDRYGLPPSCWREFVLGELQPRNDAGLVGGCRRRQERLPAPDRRCTSRASGDFRQHVFHPAGRSSDRVG